jgi:stearoyl-CoA desaturase (delta-9 desaturase)
MLVTPVQKHRAMRWFKNDTDAELIDRWFLAFALGGLVLPVVMGVILRGSTEWVQVDFVWGGLIRVFLMHHVTWSVNSICHIWGTRPFKTGDQSTNNRVIGLVAMGEGWHNNHHQFPNSAKQGLLPGQFDLSWLIIRFFENRGWVTDVKVPSDADIQKRLDEARA